MFDNKVQIPGGCFAELAVYKDQVIPEYKDNPLIEALPSILNTQDVIDRLCNYPDYRPEERNMDSNLRLHMLNRIYGIFQPLPMNIELESRISRAFRQGYVARNPLTPNYARSFTNTSINTSSYGFAVIGVSGVGKTTTINRILNLYPQVIIHSEYQSKPLTFYQLLYLKLECPYDGSIKGLMCEFFSNIDRLLGTDYYRKASNSTSDNMIIMMNQVIRNTNLGILIIDEIQHLSLSKSGGSQKMLNFFVNLVNSVGIPVILVGTPPAMGLLQNEFRQARREIGIGGNMILDRLKKGREWDLLINSIWTYQWTKHESSLTTEINDLLYDETQGITDLLVKFFVVTQANAITSGKEIINESIIKKTERENFQIVQPMIKAIRSGNSREIAKYQDVYIPDIDFTDILFEARSRAEINNIVKDRLTQIKQKEKADKKEVIDIKESIKKRDKTEKKVTLPADKSDIRVIIRDGAKEDKSAYESIREYGYIRAEIEVEE